MRSVNAFPQSLRRSLVLCFAGLFVVLSHMFAQSMITTYVGPQLPVSGNPALNQAIDQPSAAVPDGTGGLYVLSTNQNRVYAIDANGILRLVAGSTYGFSGDGGPATEARLASPSAFALDSIGNLYIADTRNNRIRKVTTDGVITTIAALRRGSGCRRESLHLRYRRPARVLGWHHLLRHASKKESGHMPQTPQISITPNVECWIGTHIGQLGKDIDFDYPGR